MFNVLGVRDPTAFAKFLSIAAPKQSYLAGRPHAEVVEPPRGDQSGRVPPPAHSRMDAWLRPDP